MSLMKTLAKVAVGVALAKGAKSMMKKQGTGLGQSGGLGGLLGGLAGASGQGRRGTHGSSGGLQDVLGGLLGGSSRGTSGGGLGGLLDGIGSRSGRGGGLGGLLAGLTTGAGAGGLLEGADRTARRHPERESASFGTVLNSQFSETPEPEIEPSQDQEAMAALMLVAMIQAAKSDGTFDETERERLFSHLGEVDADEAAFVRRQMQAPVDVEALVAQTPEGMGPQVYAVSLLAIDLDTQAEAQHLHKLAQGYGMTPHEVNDIHAEMGVPSLYT